MPIEQVGQAPYILSISERKRDIIFNLYRRHAVVDVNRRIQAGGPRPRAATLSIVMISRSAGWLLRAVNMDTTGTPEPSSLSSPEHFSLLHCTLREALGKLSSIALSLKIRSDKIVTVGFTRYARLATLHTIPQCWAPHTQTQMHGVRR